MNLFNPSGFVPQPLLGVATGRSQPSVLIIHWSHPYDAVVGPAEALGDGFRALGWRVDYLESTSGLRAKLDFSKAARHKYDIAVSLGPIPIRKKRFGRQVYDTFGDAFYLWLLDPFIHDYRRYPAFREYVRRSKTERRLGFLVPDRGYASLLADAVGSDRVRYMPFGGIRRRAAGPAAAPRFGGRLAVFATLGQELAEVQAGLDEIVSPGMDGFLTASGVSQLKSGLAYPFAGVNTTAAFVRAFGLDAGELLGSPDHLEIVCRIDAYEKRRRRVLTLGKLLDAGVEIDLFGAGWEAFCGRDNARIMGAVNYRDIPSIVQDYAGLVNFDPNWDDGYHDRVHTALVNDRLVVTTPNKAKAETLAASPGISARIVDYDLPSAEVVERLGAATLSVLSGDSEVGLRYARANDWIDRVDRFLLGADGVVAPAAPKSLDRLAAV
jgi:hypothetical protein